MTSRSAGEHWQQGRGLGATAAVVPLSLCSVPRCPVGYTGLSCQRCAPRFERVTRGPYLGTCSGCGCHGHSSTCDPVFGHCLVSSEGVTRGQGDRDTAQDHHSPVTRVPLPELPAQHGGSPVREVQTWLLRRCHQGHSHRLSPLSLSLHGAISQVGADPRDQPLMSPPWCHHHCHPQVFRVLLFGHRWPGHL